VFRFVTVGEGHDTLTDFESGLDRLEVVSPNFGGLPAGPLAASRLVNASTPLTSGAAVFVYNPASGLLTFDADGNGAGAAAPIATLSGPKTLVAADIHVLAA
jgi:Ca2+-binding RTX toxin-like protein